MSEGRIKMPSSKLKKAGSEAKQGAIVSSEGLQTGASVCSEITMQIGSSRVNTEATNEVTSDTTKQVGESKGKVSPSMGTSDATHEAVVASEATKQVFESKRKVDGVKASQGAANKKGCGSEVIKESDRNIEGVSNLEATVKNVGNTVNKAKVSELRSDVKVDDLAARCANGDANNQSGSSKEAVTQSGASAAVNPAGSGTNKEKPSVELSGTNFCSFKNSNKIYDACKPSPANRNIIAQSSEKALKELEWDAKEEMRVKMLTKKTTDVKYPPKSSSKTDYSGRLSCMSPPTVNQYYRDTLSQSVIKPKNHELNWSNKVSSGPTNQGVKYNSKPMCGRNYSASGKESMVNNVGDYTIRSATISARSPTKKLVKIRCLVELIKNTYTNKTILYMFGI